MLRSLDIKNVAVIENLNIEFKGGLTVLTGETGAGKSIIIDSINMILGSRTNKTLVRYGASKAFVSAFFDADKRFDALFEDLGIQQEDGIIISRSMGADGKSIARINGVMVPLNVLRDIAASLVNIHGQQDNQAILNDSEHIGFLDEYAGCAELLSDYGEKYAQARDLKKRLDALKTDEEEKLRRIDMLRFQIDEIEKADLKSGEKERLLEERDIAANSAKIVAGVSAAYSALYENDRASAYDEISVAADALSEISGYEKNIAELYSRLTDVKYAVEDIVHELRGINPEFDENYLNEIEERLNTITKIEKKYGGDYEAVTEFYENAANELLTLKNSDEAAENLEKELSDKKNELKHVGEAIYLKRKTAGEKLSRAIEKELADLDMEKAKFSVFLEHKDVFLKNGMDEVKFMISTNPGEPAKPLTKIASGGELSRTMLAIKTVLAECDSTDTLIFDEIDTGVSGKAAQKIAAKLWSLGKNRQVICISHQPQPAAFADNHYYIEKTVDKDSARTSVRELSDAERELEVARITDGADITETSLTHASEMIAVARKRKSEL